MNRSLAGIVQTSRQHSTLKTLQLLSALRTSTAFTHRQTLPVRLFPQSLAKAPDPIYPSHFKSPPQYRSAPLQSSSSQSILLLAFVASTAVIYWSLSSGRTDPGEIADCNMTSSQVPAGHLGNLSAEQEQKLREFWQAIADVCGWSDGLDTSSQDATKKASAPEPEPEQSSGGWGFGMFKKSDTAESASKAGHEDKFGLNKQFKEIVAKQSPESIRESIWGMTKHDHPDSLALRFLRARKWDVQHALVMFITAVNWRKNEMKLDDDIMFNGEAGALRDEKAGDGSAKQLGTDFLAQLRMGKSFLHGSDKEGRPICVVRVRLHHGGDQSAESTEKYTVHIIETARLLLQPPVETAVGFPLTDVTYGNANG